ncbi:MAG: hypothetical protein AB8H80_08130 [Planctomycetota bacterium]
MRAFQLGVGDVDVPQGSAASDRSGLGESGAVGDAAAAGAAAGSHGAASDDTSGLERERHADAGPPRLHARFRDSNGKPLVGYQVYLGPVESEARVFGYSFRTDEDGRGEVAAIEHLRDFKLTMPAWPDWERIVEIDAPGRHDVDIQLGPDHVAVEGHFTGWGEPLVKQLTTVRSMAGKTVMTRYARNSSSGGDRAASARLRMILAADSYRLLAIANGSSESNALELGDWPMVLLAGSGSHEWRHEVHPINLRIHVRDAAGRKVANGAVVLTRELRGSPAGQEWRFEQKLDGSSVAEFDRVPPGAYTLRGGGRFFRPFERELTLAPMQQSVELEVVVEGAASLRLSFRDERGKPVALGGAARKQILADVQQQALPDSDPADAALASGRGRSDLLGPFAVGAFELAFADRKSELGREFLPFDPPAVETLQLQAGVNEHCATVRPRASVRLSACVASGREDFRASIEVFLGADRVADGDVHSKQRFASHLPPGDYRIVVTRSGRVRERDLRVARRDVHLRLKP